MIMFKGTIKGEIKKMRTKKEIQKIKDKLWALYQMAEFAIAVSDEHSAKASQIIGRIKCIFQNVEKEEGESK